VITALAQTVNATSTNLLGAVTPFMEAIIVLLIGIVAPVVIFELLTYLHNKQVSQQLRHDHDYGRPEHTEHGRPGDNFGAGDGYYRASAWQ